MTYPITQKPNLEVSKEIQKQNLNKILQKNSDLLTEKYKEDIWKKYQEYFQKGFENGLTGKWNSWFGGVSVKDRAALIFDKAENPLWDLNYVISDSTAKFREWWLTTYTKNKKINHYINKNEKLTFFTSTLATKVTWTGTYYGDIDNPMANNYQLDKSGNWLEKTTLTLTPSFIRKTSTTAKAMYISENLENTSNYARIYKGNENYFINDMDYRSKNILKNYPIENKSYNYKFKIFGNIFK